MLIQFLQETLADRSAKNPRYSLRAFSQSLGLDSSTLSAILRGKRSLSVKTAQRIIEGLGVDEPALSERLLLSVVGTQEGSGKTHKETYSELDQEAFEAISSWEHFAILSFLEVRSPLKTVKLISARLRIATGTVIGALHRMERLGLVRAEAGGWVVTGRNLSTSTDIPSMSLRRVHRQYIEKAMEAIENEFVQVRDVTGITMAIDPAKIPAAKALIRDFRRKLANLLERGTQTEVYRLNIQLFPLTHNPTQSRRNHEKM